MEYIIKDISTTATTRTRAIINIFQFIELSIPEQFLFWLAKLKIEGNVINDIERNWRQGRRKRALRLFLQELQ